MVELGYEIDPAHMRKGHGTTAMRIMIDMANEITYLLPNWLKCPIFRHLAKSTKFYT